MLPELIPFEDDVTLIMSSGVQMMDFGLTLDPKRLGDGEFVRNDNAATLVRLLYDDNKDLHYRLDSNGERQSIRPTLSGIPVADSLKLLENLWVPLPVLRRHGNSFVQGPLNWARARLVPLAEGEDLKGHSHRLVVAFDTNIAAEVAEGTRYLQPTQADVDSGAPFQCVWHGHHLGGYLEQDWINNWLAELFTDQALVKLKLDSEDQQQGLRELAHQAHYLNLLWVIGEFAMQRKDANGKDRTLAIRVISNQPTSAQKPIMVDMVLDVGNSRTCGILIEDHPQQGDGLRTRYELELRDLSRPEQVYAEPFESRIEFSQALFGKIDHSVQSGRRDAFLWPTIARVGHEAARLAAKRRGTEGSTGLSSPKRYLWDEERYQSGWRFNQAFSKAEHEPPATAVPFGDLINETGEALYTLPEDERYPVFMPHYSRSSLMTFMLAETLVHALVQMNSPGQRMKMSHANTPRQLRSLILTVPPSMPKPERDIFHERVRQAIALTWKAMGWHPAGLDLNGKGSDWGENGAAACPPLPRFKTQWDEATCAQAIYLYSETLNHFGGRVEDFFATIRRPSGSSADDRLTVASIDIGGGTTDLVITDYSLDGAGGANRSIIPQQRFRDGFKVAGDDIVLGVIDHVIVPALAEALQALGLADPNPTLSRLIGSEAGIVQDMILRQQLTLQVFYPMALAILHAYERFDPYENTTTPPLTFGALLPEDSPPTPEVLAYVRNGLRKALNNPSLEFDITAVPLRLDLARLHSLFLQDGLEICKTIRSLCEVVWLYHCDVLLISGRPSRLPGIQALFRKLLALPPERIVPMHNYRTGTWYPFHHQGRIDDPKTTAAVGAMLCVLGQGRIPNFFFRANDFTTYSTVRYIGLMDQKNTVKDSDVYYRDVDLDNEEYTLPDTAFPMRGRMVLGFRQLAADRWGAASLYLLEFSEDSDKARQVLYGDRGHAAALSVTLRRDRRLKGESLEIERITTEDGASLSRDAVRIRLCTLNNAGLGEQSYWLDTGSVLH